MEKIFYLRLHFSEMIASFMMVLGILLIWTFINKHSHVFVNKWSKRLVAGILMGLITIISMLGGLALEGGHSWGNPAVAMGLATQHTWRVFTNDSNLLLIGILYIVFQLIGAILALFAYIIYVWCYNFSTKKSQEQILISQIFTFDQSAVLNNVAKDSLGALMLVLTAVGASNFSQEPTPWPVNPTMILATALGTGLAMMFVVVTFGLRAILTMNPLAWAMAFIIKFTHYLFLQKSAISLKTIGKEFISPISVMLIAAIVGLIISLMLSLPYTPKPN